MNIRILDRDGSERWRLDDQYGRLHREAAPAIIRSNGDREWWVNGNLHRTDGPAIEYASGTRQWWVDGHLHRTDGPAIIDHKGTYEWWLNGRKYTFETWCRKLRIPKKEIVVLKLKYVV